MSEKQQRYTSSLESELRELFDIATKARWKGVDPALKPESKVARDLAELVEGLVGPAGVAESIRTLSEKLPREEIAFKIAEEIVYGKFSHLEVKDAAEQAVRTALAILTEGITAAPLQGIARIAIKTNSDQSNYLAIYYAGPIRSAGGTDQALTLVVGDFVRRLLGLDRYKPTEEEINRFIEEMRLFERSVGRFQYHVSDHDLRMTLELLPVEVTGTESNPVEVQSFRNLPRVETNRVRGGALRVLNDGVIGRAAKVSTIVKKLGIEGWDWLQKLGDTEGSRESENKAGFMEDIIAGRPIFSFPSERGGFRLRYGRARNTGLAAVGIHPLTMTVLDRFLAGGTQIRIEFPGKGGVVMPVDTIEPPVVLLKNGSVARVTDQNIHDIKDQIAKILFLGDLLISFGDFLYNNKELRPSGYTEDWWCTELKLRIAECFESNMEEAAKHLKMPKKRLETILANPYTCKPKAAEAVTIAKLLSVPLHPHCTFFWTHITTQELQEMRQWILKRRGVKEDNGQASRIRFDENARVKSILERLCLPHRVEDGKIIIDGEPAHAVFASLGLGLQDRHVDASLSSLDALNTLSDVTIRAKAPTILGARMGRPEKAKRRDMKPRVHLLFPVGLAGGSQRDLISASQKGPIRVELARRRCLKCGKPASGARCQLCSNETAFEKYCPLCGKKVEVDVCPSCKAPTKCFTPQTIDLKAEIRKAGQALEMRPPRKVKGVKGLTNEKKSAEIIEKGILRSKEDLSVYKDGTIRFDATNAPLTHFKPEEVEASIDKLKQLGYFFDIEDKPLNDKEQICELKVQDVIIPRKCAMYFVRVARFIDQLLERLYKLPKYYNVKEPKDLIGNLIVGLAPHTSAGILGRVAGFTKLNVCYAHPLWHSAKRRDCDGDEDALMLALDTLLNFSTAYLPSQIGGIMDAPLFLIPVVNPLEVQRQAHEFDVSRHYSAEFYKATLKQNSSVNTRNLVDLVADRLATETQFEGFGFTVPVSNINLGNRESMYKKLRKMTDKLKGQLELAEKIEAVNAKEVAWKVLTKHFLRDISGNLRAFSTQGFRCRLCNRRFRRIPLRGKCPKCGGILSLTVYRGGIEKYLEAAQFLIEKYKLPKYYLQRIELVRDEISTLFEGKKPRQVSLADFA